VTGRFGQIFGAGTKPLIAMAHLGPLPGTPLYDEARGVQGIVDDVARDLDVLLAFPFDAVMFCNEGDRPYSLRAGFEGVAVMARVAADLGPDDRPFGVDFLWDGRAALAVAAATGAAFIREVVTGAYESDMGVWAPDAGELLRYRRTLGASQIAVFMNVTPEFAATSAPARWASSPGPRPCPAWRTRSWCPARWPARHRTRRRYVRPSRPPATWPRTGQHRGQGRQRGVVPRGGGRHHRGL
jgi:BtpA family